MGLPQAGMMPEIFCSMLVNAGASKAFCKKVWARLAPQLTQTTIYHMLHIRSGSPQALAYVVTAISPQLLLEAIDAAGPPSGARRPPELLRLERELLSQVDGAGEWL